ncbi:hypothetical protein AWC13_09660 [Mycobacterium kubicae]|nr:hypothetical protein AWC13_09660 [Mycobacterium kubicae]
MTRQPTNNSLRSASSAAVKRQRVRPAIRHVKLVEQFGVGDSPVVVARTDSHGHGVKGVSAAASQLVAVVIRVAGVDCPMNTTQRRGEPRLAATNLGRLRI